MVRDIHDYWPKTDTTYSTTDSAADGLPTWADEEPTMEDIWTAYANPGGSGGWMFLTEDTATLGDYFFWNLGRMPTASERDKLEGGSADEIYEYFDSLEQKQTGGGSGGGGGGGAVVGMSYEQYAAYARYLWENLGCIEVLAEAEIRDWISKGWFESQEGILLIKERIKSLPAYYYGSVSKTERILWREDWETMTGVGMNAEQLKLRDEMYQKGYSREQWRDYVKQQPEYKTGIESDALKQTYLDALYKEWGYEQVDSILADNPNYVEDVLFAELGEGADYSVIVDWARKQPQYLKGGGAATTREALYQTYLEMMNDEPDADWINDRVLAGWNVAQMAQYLRGTAEYQQMYAGKPAYMSESTYISYKNGFNTVARVHFAQGDTSYSLSDQEIANLVDQGWTPSEWDEYLEYKEVAWSNLEYMNWVGEALGKTYTYEDAFKVASWGEGSGAIKAEQAKGEKRRTYDTYFAILNGRAPTLADYEALERDYMSAQHYYQVALAQQDAEADFPEIDELMTRVYGYGADLQKLVDINLNREGSGAYEALIQAAEELDRYRLVFRLDRRRDPTPEEYAGFAGYAGPDELAKEIAVREAVVSEGPAIKNLYDWYWTKQGASPLSEDDLVTLTGKYEGWGAIQRRLDIAEARRKQREQSVAMSLRWGAAISPISYTEFGGPKLPGLRRIGG